MAKPEQAAIYVRISDDRERDAAGVGRQENDARAFADRLGWTITETVTENDVSAFKRRKVKLPNGEHAHRVVRPAFRRLLDMIEHGQVDGFIAYHLDRVARDPRDLEDLIDVVERARIPVESVTGSLRLATDSDITMARIGVAIANQSSRDSSRRIKRKHDELAEAGKYAGGGARRFGFERDGITHAPREAEAIRWAASRVLAGDSVSKIGRDLDDRGIHPVKAAKWSSKSLGDILRSPRVAGLRVHRGEVVGTASWEPVLDAETHEAVLATLSARSHGAGKPSLSRWLNGILMCGPCGHGLTGAFVAKGRNHRYWCDTRRGGCGKIAIDAERTEEEISHQVLEYLSTPKVIERLSRTTSTQGAERARADIAEDEIQLKALSRMWAEKQITLDEYAEARKIIEKRLSDARTVVQSAVPQQVRRVLAADDLADAWKGLDPAGRRELVQLLVEGWTVRPADPRRSGQYQPERLAVLARE